MLAITTVNDVKNEFLSRREIICDFSGGAGILKKLDAIDAVTKEHSLEGKIVIPIRLQNHVGRSHTTGTFFIYEDETLAKKHINKSFLDRIEKLRTAKAEAQKAKEEAEKPPETKSDESDTPKDTESKSEKPDTIENKESKSEKPDTIENKESKSEKPDTIENKESKSETLESKPEEKDK